MVFFDRSLLKKGARIYYNIYQERMTGTRPRQNFLLKYTFFHQFDRYKCIHKLHLIFSHFPTVYVPTSLFVSIQYCLFSRTMFYESWNIHWYCACIFLFVWFRTKFLPNKKQGRIVFFIKPQKGRTLMDFWIM